MLFIRDKTGKQKISWTNIWLKEHGEKLWKAENIVLARRHLTPEHFTLYIAYDLLIHFTAETMRSI